VRAGSCILRHRARPELAGWWVRDHTPAGDFAWGHWDPGRGGFVREIAESVIRDVVAAAMAAGLGRDPAQEWVNRRLRAVWRGRQRLGIVRVALAARRCGEASCAPSTHVELTALRSTVASSYCRLPLEFYTQPTQVTFV